MTAFSLLTLELDGSTDASTLRHVGRRAARLLGLADVDATRVATSVSEIGRLAHGRGPLELELGVDATAMSITVGFAGAAALFAAGGQVHTATARLMDHVEAADDRITIVKSLPGSLDDAELTAVRDELLRESSADPHGLLQGLNDELVSTLLALREREAELVALNAELDQTNRGVVALYAELEQRATEVRHAQRVVFEKLEDALRPPPPVVPGLELAVRYVPAQQNSPTGGDLYDWFVLPDGTLHITVVDVLGHGVEGTRDALQVTHAVRTLTLEGHQLGQLLSRADAILQSVGTSLVATALLGRLDPASGVLRLAGAGHPLALRIPTEGEPVYLEAPGRPIGYERAGSDRVSVIQLAPGDSVLLYTDGLVEIRRDILEGMDTLIQAASQARRMRLLPLLDSTLSACARNDPLNDDTLLLAARWTPPV